MFADCDGRTLDRLTDALTARAHRPRDVIMRQGERGTSFVLVLEGTVAVSRVDDAGLHVLGSAGPGSVLGELAMLTGGPRRATVEAVTTVRVAQGDLAAFELLLDAPGVHERIAGLVAHRLADIAVPARVSLRDETRLVLRPLLASDREMIETGLAQTSRESLRRRFFSGGPPSARVIDHLVNIDYIDHFAWAALAEDGQHGVSVARYVRARRDREEADLAFFVADGLRGRGLATILLGALGAAAWSAGITRFVASVLAENVEMRAVLDKAGATWHLDEPGVVSASLDVASAADLVDSALRSALSRTAHDVVTAAGLALAHPM